MFAAPDRSPVPHVRTRSQHGVRYWLLVGGRGLRPVGDDQG